jgi:hypothetical protein
VRAAPEEDDQAPHRQTSGPEPAPVPARQPEPDPPADGTEPPAPAAAATAPKERGPRDRRHDRAVTLLAGLRHSDDRLILSRRDVDRLAPAVVSWFDAGVTPAGVHRFLTDDLPPVMRHPAAVITYRLRELLPPPLPTRPRPSPAGAMDTRATPRPAPLQTCDGCERAFRAPGPGRCRDCRSIPLTTVDPRHAA